MIRSLHSALSSGDEVGRYRLIAELARGGMGIVYLASTRGPAGFNKLHALKQLKPELVEDPSFLTMFLDEARVAARLSHPNIVQTNDVEQSDGRYFIAMEYLDGRSLSQITKRCARKEGFPLHMSLMVLRDVLSALDYAHSFKVEGAPQGVVHRDISPQNIFLTFDGFAKVIDFGIAKAHDSAIETKTGVLKGKLSYMAPEQLGHRAEPRSDLFATGAVLFEVVTGRRLWAGRTEMEVMAHLARNEIPSVEAASREVPPALLRICRMALAPRVEDRFASAALMRDAIDEYLWTARITPQSQEVGALLTEEFGTEREATRAAIEAYMAGALNGEVLPLLPLLPLGAAETASPVPSRPASIQAQLSSQVPGRAGLPRGLGPSIEHRGSLTRKLAPVAALAVMLIGIMIGLGWRGAASVRVPVPALAPAASSPAQREGPGLEPTPLSMIAFSVTVAPPSAQVLIDGEPMPSNPFMGKFPKDYVVHRVRASAPGFVAKERVVSFADNVMVDLSLDPKKAPLAPVALPRRREPPSARKLVAVQPPAPQDVPQPAHPAPVPAPAAPSPPSRSSLSYDITPKRPSDAPLRRAIDSSNPYGEDQ